VGSSQYLYNAKMREEIAEQLGVTPTPGGLEILLRQSENNRMAHGGIVHLADGGEPRFSALRDFGSAIWNETPNIIANQMTGGIFGAVKQVGDYIAKKNKAKKDEERWNRMRDPFADPEPQKSRGPYNLDAYNWSPSRGANLSGSDNTRWVGMMNIGGSRGFGKGAGGNFGEGQRMETRERRIMKNMPIEQRLELERRGFGRGAQAARERVAANPSAGLSKPSNYDELAAYYIKHGGFDESAPVVQWGAG